MNIKKIFFLYITFLFDFLKYKSNYFSNKNIEYLKLLIIFINFYKKINYYLLKINLN